LNRPSRAILSLTVLLPCLVPQVARGQSPFASSVVEYSPAPGQFVNDAQYNDPGRALGPPVGGGTHDGNESSVVTLGGFGGRLTLAFDHVVEDHPLNPFGMDAIVFGNAFWLGADFQRHWAECAVIEIALDANENGTIDDEEGWYLIPGSHIVDAPAQLATVTWDDDPDTVLPPEYLSWIPPGQTGTWTTSAVALPEDVFGTLVIVNPAVSPDEEGIYGYADYAPTLVLGDLDGDGQVDDPMLTPEAFYTVPDDPWTSGVTPGSGGGDAFDIAWAIDPVTGRPAGLTGFDFIRFTSPVDVILTYFNEKSPEIDAVADAAPDPFGDCDDDGDIDLRDVAYLQLCFGDGRADGLPCARMDRDADGYVFDADVAAFVARLTGPT
jgi:hypothetical protein